jgi:hypothetical protein
MIFNSHFESVYLWLPLIGFLVGLIGSLIGGGGGFFFIPVLTLLFHVPAQIALSTSLAATIPICLVGSIGHYRRGNVDMSTALLFIIAGLFGAFTGAAVTNFFSNKTLRISWGIYAILIAIQMLVSNFQKKKDENRGIIKNKSEGFERITKGSLFGFVAGIITSTFGTTGATPIQAGMFALRIPIKLLKDSLAEHS